MQKRGLIFMDRVDRAGVAPTFLGFADGRKLITILEVGNTGLII